MSLHTDTENALHTPAPETHPSQRAIITVLGKNRSGIVFEVSKILARLDINILDISQTILQDIFTMTMLVDLSHTAKPAVPNTVERLATGAQSSDEATFEVDFAHVRSELKALETLLDIQINIQREEVFKYMYRL